ncbi:kinase-like protein [Rhizophagus irregularis]|uniref:Kinase-like protein n=1 Tax=Rhizophagus irregularis TaxID=588596 RepID=A0A2I1HA24_9GLOM|nr:kinase-like protein [Rhizophagus irregularis]
MSGVYPLTFSRTPPRFKVELEIVKCGYESYHIDAKTGLPVLYLRDQKCEVWIKFVETYPNGMMLKIQRKVDFHDNVIRCHGITKFESDNQIGNNNYIMVMEYADGGSLRNYLEKNFNRLTWDDKLDMAYQLAYAVSCLHNEGIIHRDLHSGNILVHQNMIKLADFGGQPPFYVEGEEYDVSLILEISQGLRETVVPDTPEEYVKIYTKCWDGEPDNRPTIYQVVDLLRAIITKTDIITENLSLLNEQEFSEIHLNTNNLESQGELSQLIQNFNKMNTKEIDNIAVSNKQEKLITDKDFNRILKLSYQLLYLLN